MAGRTARLMSGANLRKKEVFACQHWGKCRFGRCPARRIGPDGVRHLQRISVNGVREGRVLPVERGGDRDGRPVRHSASVRRRRERRLCDPDFRQSDLLEDEEIEVAACRWHSH